MLIEPHIETPEELYENDLWAKEEAYRFYIKERRRNCNFRQIMDLWLHAPYCAKCAVSDPFVYKQPADISWTTWKEDVAWKLGIVTLRSIKRELRKHRDYALICKRCNTELRPWDGHEVWIVTYHVEEHYRIPLEEPGKKAVSRRMRNRILELYDRMCFGCAITDSELHLDHILPRSKGGTAAFRNLQPLCEDCGNLKGDELPEEVDVYSDIYFGPYSSDWFDGLFW